ncbi:MAG: ATP-binding protein [Planctomycetota bacterium]
MTPSESPSLMSRPFAAAPDANRYFPSAAIEEARQRITRAVKRGEGPVLVVGSAGLGKTLLLDVIARQFGKQLKSVTLMGGQLCTRRALLQMILFQLDLPYRDMDEGEMRLALMGHLRPSDGDARHILLLVDEADAIPQRLLEELRALTNLSANGQIQANLVLAGSSNLEEQFADPKLHLFSQRVSGRCYLSAFGRTETFRYIQAQVAATGQDPAKLFTDEGLEAIFAATDGVPRLINQLGDQLMWMVEETGYSPLDAMIVQQAWSELQQLPAPWNTQSKQPVATAVEFGELASGDPTPVEFIADDNTYELDFEDDLPASIPMHVSQTDAAADAEVQIESDTLELTEQLLDELHITDTSAPQTITDSAARNPFAESFDSEEILLDRYSAFESVLLDEAPRVINSNDTSFSTQLQQLETHDGPSTQVTLPQLTELVGGCTVCDTCNAEPDVAAVEPGELLVIEDDISNDTAVVSGQKFRQLFSSLESSTGSSCFG